MKKEKKDNSSNINFFYDFYNYIKTNHVYLIFIYLFTIALYGAWAFQYFVSFDSEGLYFKSYGITNNGWYHQWAGLGRWAFVFLKKILGVQVINPFFSITLFLILFPLSAFLWHYYLDKIGFKSKNVFEKIIFDLVYLSHPIWALQFAYRNQIEVLSIIAVLSPITSYYFLHFLENLKDKRNLIGLFLSFIGVIFCFAGYQAFIFMYVLFMFIYIFKNSISDDFEYKSFWINTIKIGIASIIAFVSYLISSKVICYIFKVNMKRYNYMSTQINWNANNFMDNINSILNYFHNIIFGDGIVYSCLFGIELVLSIITIILLLRKHKNKFQRPSIIFSFLMILVIPFTLTILTAGVCVERQQFSVVFLISFLIIFIYSQLIKENKKALIVFAIVVISFLTIQIQMNTRLLYSDYYTMRQDYNLYNTIYNKAMDLGAEPGAPIYIYGSYSNYPNDTIVEKEVIGFAYSEVNQIASEKYVQAMISEGFNVSIPTEDERKIAKKHIADMKSYPNKDFVEVYDGIIIVKFSD